MNSIINIIIVIITALLFLMILVMIVEAIVGKTSFTELAYNAGYFDQSHF